MHKKIYVAPVSKCFNLELESIIAGSIGDGLDVNENGNSDNADKSQERMWHTGSNIWN